MTPTRGRKPRTGDKLLRVRFRNGVVGGPFKADQLQWGWDRPGFGKDWDWDVVAVEKWDG